jgi:hypothetical protein
MSNMPCESWTVPSTGLTKYHEPCARCSRPAMRLRSTPMGCTAAGISPTTKRWTIVFTLSDGRRARGCDYFSF